MDDIVGQLRVRHIAITSLAFLVGATSIASWKGGSLALIELERFLEYTSQPPDTSFLIIFNSNEFERQSSVWVNQMTSKIIDRIRCRRPLAAAPRSSQNVSLSVTSLEDIKGSMSSTLTVFLLKPPQQYEQSKLEQLLKESPKHARLKVDVNWESVTAGREDAGAKNQECSEGHVPARAYTFTSNTGTVLSGPSSLRHRGPITVCIPYESASYAPSRNWFEDEYPELSTVWSRVRSLRPADAKLSLMAQYNKAGDVTVLGITVKRSELAFIGPGALMILTLSLLLGLRQALGWALVSSQPFSKKTLWVGLMHDDMSRFAVYISMCALPAVAVYASIAIFGGSQVVAIAASSAEWILGSINYVLTCRLACNLDPAK